VTSSHGRLCILSRRRPVFAPTGLSGHRGAGARAVSVVMIQSDYGKQLVSCSRTDSLKGLCVNDDTGSPSGRAARSNTRMRQFTGAPVALRATDLFPMSSLEELSAAEPGYEC